MNEIIFNGINYAPTADFDLLLKAYNAGIEKGLTLKLVMSSRKIFSIMNFQSMKNWRSMVFLQSKWKLQHCIR